MKNKKYYVEDEILPLIEELLENAERVDLNMGRFMNSTQVKGLLQGIVDRREISDKQIATLDKLWKQYQRKK